MSGQAVWAWASWTGEKGSAAAATTTATRAGEGGGDGRDRASATRLSCPGVWRAVIANSDMKASCRCWRAEFGGERR